jgi:hypothetical protein
MLSPCSIRRTNVAKISGKPAGGKSTVNGEEALRGVGVGLYALHFRLAELDPNEWYSTWREVVDEIYVYSAILSVLYPLAEEELESKIVQLPEGVYALNVPNPFFEQKRKTPAQKGTEVDTSLWDEPPF